MSETKYEVGQVVKFRANVSLDIQGPMKCEYQIMGLILKGEIFRRVLFEGPVGKEEPLYLISVTGVDDYYYPIEEMKSKALVRESSILAEGEHEITNTNIS